MSHLHIDYSGLGGSTPGGGTSGSAPSGGTGRSRGDGGAGRSVPARLLRGLATAATLALLPFIILIRGGVFAYDAWGLGTWPSLSLAGIATALLLGAYAWILARRIGTGPRLGRLVARASAGVGIAYVAWALVFVAAGNVKSPDVRAEYVSVHPLLRIAASALILVDPGAVITDAGRTREDYRRMGLPQAEASLHFEQSTGWVHALDLRTTGRPEWRNRAVAFGFRAMGFRSLRHVGTADHLHLSLGLPSEG